MQIQVRGKLKDRLQEYASSNKLKQTQASSAAGHRLVLTNPEDNSGSALR
jgi:hypothetical protein